MWNKLFWHLKVCPYYRLLLISSYCAPLEFSFYHKLCIGAKQAAWIVICVTKLRHGIHMERTSLENGGQILKKSKRFRLDMPKDESCQVSLKHFNIQDNFLHENQICGYPLWKLHRKKEDPCFEWYFISHPTQVATPFLKYCEPKQKAKARVSVKAASSKIWCGSNDLAPADTDMLWFFYSHI